MNGYILTKSFHVKAVEATPEPERPAYLRVGNRTYRADEVYPTARAAVEAGERILYRLQSEARRREAELNRRAGSLKVARNALGPA